MFLVILLDNATLAIFLRDGNRRESSLAIFLTIFHSASAMLTSNIEVRLQIIRPPLAI
jgi:hypothetical protein